MLRREGRSKGEVRGHLDNRNQQYRQNRVQGEMVGVDGGGWVTGGWVMERKKERERVTYNLEGGSIVRERERTANEDPSVSN